ncbi:MAG TPA: hypothetical protein DIT64_15230, partial [Verrucomicrobiales bacterium]|nr:hypothetical protein [Verrucomicrobiales bacterium]
MTGGSLQRNHANLTRHACEEKTRAQSPRQDRQKTGGQSLRETRQKGARQAREESLRESPGQAGEKSRSQTGAKKIPPPSEEIPLQTRSQKTGPKSRQD